MRPGADVTAGEPRPFSPTPSAGDGYKPHVDGLRAISIAAVVAYHAGMPGVSGGFVGVDIFFVISGFLIINQIVAGLGSGRFGIFDFYARRALRILPSYGAMLVFTLAGATLLLRSRADLDSYAVSALLAPLFLTNFYFHFRSGYFDAAAETKPLLHTWSLAVEEQFYLVVPLLILGLFIIARRRRWPPAPLLGVAAAAIFAASLAGCILATPHDINPWAAERNPAFFFTWWRAWEFVAGGVIAALARPLAGRRGAGPAGLIGGVGGLALLYLSITFTGLAALGAGGGAHGRILGFPGYAALLPVLGGALVIWSGLVAPRGPVARLLSLAPVVYLGQISYALYLWHWPLIVFGRMLPLEADPAVIDAVAVVLAVLFAIATRYLIELPVLAWRRRVRLGSDLRLPVRVFLAGVAGCIAVAVLTGAVMGIAHHAAGNNQMLAAIDAAKAEPRDPCGSSTVESARDCPGPAKVDGILFGDSHAFAMKPRLTLEAEKAGLSLLQLATPGCDPIDVMVSPEESARNYFCIPLVEKLARMKQGYGTDARFVILDGYWNAPFRQPGVDPAAAGAKLREGFGKLLDMLAAPGRRILVVGPLPSFRRADPFNCVDLAGALHLSVDRCGVSRADEDAWRAETVAVMRAVTAEHPGARFIDPIDLFCDERMCSPVKDGTLAFFDDNHLNEYGALRMFERFRADYEWAFGS